MATDDTTTTDDTTRNVFEIADPHANARGVKEPSFVTDSLRIGTIMQ